MDEEKAALRLKLAVGEPNDMYEQEADRMADRIQERGSSIERREAVHAPPITAIHRTPAGASSDNGVADNSVEKGINRLRGKGAQLRESI